MLLCGLVDCCGSIATEPTRAKIRQCPLLFSESDHQADEWQRIAAFASALVAGDVQHVELADQVKMIAPSRAATCLACNSFNKVHDVTP